MQCSPIVGMEGSLQRVLHLVQSQQSWHEKCYRQAIPFNAVSSGMKKASWTSRLGHGSESKILDGRHVVFGTCG